MKFEPVDGLGQSRYRHTLPGDCHMDALLVNKESDTLVVAFHGALNRQKYAPPRYERFRSLDKFSVSALYLGDPALYIGPKLELAWYTGWHGLDLYPLFAAMITAAAAKIGASNIVLTGGSGGGFAALQVSALIPESVAVVYNPQTSIYAYEHPKWPYMPQRSYIRHVWPELLDGPAADFDFSTDWTVPMGDRLSAVRRYSTPRDNRVVFMINRQDTHHIEKHFKPFADVMEVNPARLKVIEYDGGSGHNPTTFAQFKEALDGAVDWVGACLES
ncbi:hypothetical protein [Arthrobacter rhombi]|uniref:hypothetical protein n=1 Tax=Arthrobacter rhombi TaxID=71253 RepID=UPI003FD3D7EC